MSSAFEFNVPDNGAASVHSEDEAHSHIEWLRQNGTTDIPHSSRVLNDHLFGVYKLLKKWNNPEDVCLAGLFHSVYGTQTFDCSCLTVQARPAVKQRIGERAERWVYLFATQNRDLWFDAVDKCAVSIFDESGYATRVSASDLSVLLEMELANIVEQLPHRASTSEKTLRVYEQQIEKAASVVSTAALIDSRNAIRSANV